MGGKYLLYSSMLSLEHQEPVPKYTVHTFRTSFDLSISVFPGRGRYGIEWHRYYKHSNLISFGNLIWQGWCFGEIILSFMPWNWSSSSKKIFHGKFICPHISSMPWGLKVWAHGLCQHVNAYILPSVNAPVYSDWGQSLKQICPGLTPGPPHKQTCQRCKGAVRTGSRHTCPLWFPLQGEWVNERKRGKKRGNQETQQRASQITNHLIATRKETVVLQQYQGFSIAASADRS